MKSIKLKSLALLGLTAITTLSCGGDKQLDSYSMMLVSKYFNSYQDFINLVKTCKAYNIVGEFRYNPIPLDSEPINIDVGGEEKKVNVWELFSNIETAYIYGSESSDFLKELESKLPETVTKIHCCDEVSYYKWLAILKSRIYYT